MSQEFLLKAWEAKGQQDFVGAEANYLACLKCDPENAEAYRELGLMYWGRFKKTAEAIELIERSLSIQDCADGHFFLAMVNQEHDRAKAANEFLKALDAYKLECDATGLMGHAHCYYAELLAEEAVSSKQKSTTSKLFGSTLRTKTFKETTQAFKNIFARSESILRPAQHERACLQLSMCYRKTHADQRAVASTYATSSGPDGLGGSDLI